jgi:hypothetical protein
MDFCQAREKLFHWSMSTLSQGNWISLQCHKWGSVTFGKDPLKAIFLANDRNLLKRLKEYCLAKKIRMSVDKTRSLFTFQMNSRRRAESSVY